MGAVTVTSEVRLRRAGAGDLDAVIALAGAALGWDPTEPNGAWFRWKHLDNPFGASPMWVAEDEAGLVGFRTFLRWELRRGTSVARCVRAVDTATAPAAQGRGIFTELTTVGLDGLAADGVEFVFNTPNQRSRPGYLKMGWQVIGRPRTTMRVGSVSGLARLPQARRPADKFSVPCDVGDAARDAFGGLGPTDGRFGDGGFGEDGFGEDGFGHDLVGRLVAACRPADRSLSTNRSPAYLAWRYGFAPLDYRVVVGPDGIEGGCVVFRVRHRGSATEVAVAEVLVPGRDPEVEQRLLAEVRRRTRADYLLRIDRGRLGRGGFLPLPGQGPVLTWRAVSGRMPPRLEEWDLSLGDLELL